MKEQIEFSEFLEIEKKLEIVFGQILTAERVEKSKKMLKLSVTFGPEESDKKTVMTNLGSTFEPEAFVGLVLPFVVNLKPVDIMGVTSEAMIVVGNFNDRIELVDYSIGTKLL